MELLPGDIVVLGSDGLFDNMWDKELESIVAKYLKVKIFWRFCCAVLVRSGRHAHNEGEILGAAACVDPAENSGELATIWHVMVDQHGRLLGQGASEKVLLDRRHHCHDQ